MSCNYHFECPHCKRPEYEKPEDYYGKVSIEEYEAKKLIISQEELMDYPSLRADAEVSLVDGKLIVRASCYCTKCGAQCSLKFSKTIDKGPPLKVTL